MLSGAYLRHFIDYALSRGGGSGGSPPAGVKGAKPPIGGPGAKLPRRKTVLEHFAGQK